MLGHIEKTSSQGKSCPFRSSQNPQMKLLSQQKYPIFIVIVFYPQTQNKEYTKLTQFKTEIRPSRVKSCAFH